VETVVVTGAGAGTGREYVKLFLADGAQVVAVSLLKDELDDLLLELDPGDGRLLVKQADLALPEAAEDLLAWCDEQALEVDVLVNNAGFAVYGDPTEVGLDRVEQMLMLNVVGSTKISTVFAQRMKTRGSGRILVMGSTAGLMPTMRFASYGASKAYTNTFTHCLGAALKGTGVSVTLVAPGSFKSKFAATADIESSQAGGLMRKLYESEKLDAPTVARAGHRALRRGRRQVTVGAKGHAAKIGGRLFSPVWLARISRGL
jgi:short-subunit dehydrogenase